MSKGSVRNRERERERETCGVERYRQSARAKLMSSVLGMKRDEVNYLSSLVAPPKSNAGALSEGGARPHQEIQKFIFLDPPKIHNSFVGDFRD